MQLEQLFNDFKKKLNLRIRIVKNKILQAQHNFTDFQFFRKWSASLILKIPYEISYRRYGLFKISLLFIVFVREKATVSVRRNEKILLSFDCYLQKFFFVIVIKIVSLQKFTTIRIVEIT